MKSGASDPFADDDAEEEAQSPSETNDAAADDSSESDASAGDARDAESRDAAMRNDAARDGEATNSEADAPPSDADDGLSRDELPLILRRDRVKDERPEVHQLFVQRETHETAVDAERALEKRLGEGLSRTDAREAIYLAGMRHLDDAEEILREWGYDL